MFVRFKIILILVFPMHLAWISLEANDSKTPKYTLSVCAIFKNEAKYLKEWIEYHKLVGVDHFYLYSCGSTDRFFSVLKPYVISGTVKLINWPDMSISCSNPIDENENDYVWSLSSQVTAYENACKFRAIGETKWLVFLDIDEFLLPNNGENLVEMLENYKDYPGVILSRNFYDTSDIDSVSQKKLIIESTKMVGSPPKNPFREVEKTIFKPELCECFSWPPFKYKFKGEKEAIKVGRQEIRINNYTNRGIIPLHYRKIKAHIDNSILTNDELKAVLENGYEIEDQERKIFLFIPDVLRNLGYEPFFVNR